MIRPSPSSLQFGFPIKSPISPDLSPSPSPSLWEKGPALPCRGAGRHEGRWEAQTGRVGDS